MYALDTGQCSTEYYRVKSVIAFSTVVENGKKYDSSGATAVRVPRVPRHPLKFSNGCQALVLREIFDTKKPIFLKNSQFFCILGVKFVCPRILFMLGTRPVKAMAPPLINKQIVIKIRGH